MAYEPAPKLLHIYPFRASEDECGAEECQICGEPADDEMGEFCLPEGMTDPGGSPTIVAHGQCGLDFNLEIA